jgi:hypothetical protein
LDGEVVDVVLILLLEFVDGVFEFVLISRVEIGFGFRMKEEEEEVVVVVVVGRGFTNVLVFSCPLVSLLSFCFGAVTTFLFLASWWYLPSCF